MIYLISGKMGVKPMVVEIMVKVVVVEVILVFNKSVTDFFILIWRLENEPEANQ